MHKYDIELNADKPDVLNMMYDSCRNGSEILEVGCGNGRLTRRLCEKGCRVSIVEKDPILYGMASVYADEGICGDAMNVLPEAFLGRTFDYIIFADVLEHLSAPEKLLASVRSLLAVDGLVLISVPNFAHNDILLRLYDDSLAYTETGIMDQSHLRVFTYEIARQMFEAAGYHVVRQDCVSRMTGCTEQYITQEYPVTDFLRSLEKRERGTIYQYYFELQAGESKGEIIDDFAEHADMIERRILFDRGDGYHYEDQLSFYARKKDRYFSISALVPEEAKVVRFDPVMKTPCIIRNIEVTSNERTLHVTADTEEDHTIIFRTIDPSIYITDLKDVKWICISGEIEYDYNLLSESREHSLERELLAATGIINELQNEKQVLLEKINMLEVELKKQEADWSAELDKQRSSWQDELARQDKDWREELNKQEQVWRDELLHQNSSWREEIKKRERAWQDRTESVQLLYEKKIRELNEQINNCQKKEEELYIKVGQREGIIQCLTEEKNRIERENKDQRTHIVDTEATLLDMQQAYESLRSEKADQAAEFEKQIQLNENALSKISNENDQLKREITALHQNMEQSSREASEKLSAVMNELTKTAEVSEARDANISHLQRVNVECERVISEQKRQNRELRNLIKVYEGSTSWRVTAPFRRIMQIFRKKNSMKTITMEERSEAAEKLTGLLPLAWNQTNKSWNYDTVKEDYFPLVSVIVPNYNHAPYLRERLESIYGQTYTHIEVILLDDCSTDNSRDIMTEYAEKYPSCTRCYFNNANSGKIIMQWNLGITKAKGDLIWIAESDDYCERQFLEVMVALMARESVQLAFCRSDFMQDGEKTWDTEQYLSDISEFDWRHDFVTTADEIVSKAFSIKNIIPNVSSVVFRNIGSIRPEFCLNTENLRLSSDWMFYLELIRGGCIAYTPRVTNYYRIHTGSTSLKIQQTDAYYEEYEAVLRYAVSIYDVPEENFIRVQHILKEHYRAIHAVADAEIVDRHFSVERIKNRAKQRKLHVIMTSFSMQHGGGEMYAIYLSNEMRRQGLTVTLLNLNLEQYLEEIRKLLDPGVPLINVKSTDDLYHILRRIGGDIIHTHHGSADQMIALWLADHDLPMKQVVTLHGMYEMMSDDIFKRTVEDVDPVCRKYIYIADKNLEPFIRSNYYDSGKFVKITNGLPRVKTEKLNRGEFGLTKSDFVLVLASRGIPEKGWAEAVEAVKIANKTGGRRICLFILGDGVMRGKLQKEASDTIKFLGVRSDVRDFYAMADAGLLPTWFKGESCPLVIIECLQSGTPVIATEIAEVRYMLSDSHGELAGKLISLQEGRTNPDEIASAIRSLADDRRYYQKLRQRVGSAAAKFDIEGISRKYIEVYEEVAGR